MSSADSQSSANNFQSKRVSEAAPDRIYVLTPEAAVVELPEGATPIDFAYTLHTNLGHRCRGAHIDGVMVPLNTVLKNGQTVSITAIKDGGPSRDWLNPELGFSKRQSACEGACLVQCAGVARDGVKGARSCREIIATRR